LLERFQIQLLFFNYKRRATVIRKLKNGKYRLYSKKKNPKTGKRRNLGTFNTRAAAQKHEREVQLFQAPLDRLR